MTAHFQSHPIYYLLTLLSTILILLMVWSLSRATNVGTLLFTLVAIGATLWFVANLQTKVLLSKTGLVLHRRFGQIIPWQTATIDLEYRQLISVEPSGRLLPVLILLYYPKQPNGLLDLDHIVGLTLPLLTNQEELRQKLTDMIPA
ncbi:MAG: hypothetical protein R2932_27035 [Caldilineaceae bacterium]